MPSQEELHRPGIRGWGAAGGWAALREHLAAALSQRVEAEGWDAEEAEGDNQEFLGQQSQF